MNKLSFLIMALGVAISTPTASVRQTEAEFVPSDNPVAGKLAQRKCVGVKPGTDAWKACVNSWNYEAWKFKQSGGKGRRHINE